MIIIFFSIWKRKFRCKFRKKGEKIKKYKENRKKDWKKHIVTELKAIKVDLSHEQLTLEISSFVLSTELEGITLTKAL